MDLTDGENNVDSFQSQSRNTKKQEESGELWDSIGFHRPLAGFWYNLAFVILGLVFGIIFGTYLYKLMYPFPESLGYKGAATGIFGLFFTIMDLGTANVVNRYLGEMAIKDPKKMLKYIQYFIWYQSFTGLIQTTTVSIYALYFVPRTELAYAVWIMLIQSTTQYPGYLWIFKDILGSQQQFHKTIILGFLTGDIIQRITEILFVLWGQAYGRAHPEIGLIMGIAIGSIIGTYIDDFIAMIVSAYFFKNLLSSFGLSIKDCFRHDFDLPLVKETLLYSVKIGAPGLLWPLVGTYALWLWLLYVPQYTTFATLAGFAGTFAGITEQNLSLGGAISEAYMNGKKKLTQYYLGQSIRFAGFMQGFTIAIILIIIPVLPFVLAKLGMEYYVLSVSFIIPGIVRRFQQPYNNISEDIITQSNHPNASFLLHLYEDLMAFFSWTLFIVWLKIPQNYGMIAIAWLIPCAELLAINSKILLNYIFIHKNVVEVKIPVWQAWGAPTAAAAVMYGVGRLMETYIFWPIYYTWGLYPALIIVLLIAIIVFPIMIYGPITGLLGGWDDWAVDIFEKVAKMSGPSKFIVIPIFLSIKYSSKISPLHNRFRHDATEAMQEAWDLTAQKRAWYIKNQKTE